MNEGIRDPRVDKLLGVGNGQAAQVGQQAGMQVTLAGESFTGPPEVCVVFALVKIYDGLVGIAQRLDIIAGKVQAQHDELHELAERFPKGGLFGARR